MGVVVTIAVVVVILLFMASGGGGAGRRDITETVTLTDQEEEWLLAGRGQWDEPLEAAWRRAVRKGERYETKGGAPRLRLGGLGPDEAQLDALARIAYLAGEAERERLEAGFIEKHGPDTDPWDDPKVARKEERLERRVEKLEGRLYDAGSKYQAKNYWWNQLDSDERGQLRRAGQNWRDFMN